MVRNGLVMAQVAGSLLLLIVAGLFVRSARKAEQIYLGFNPDHVLDIPIDVKQIGYSDEQGKAFFREAEQRLQGLPGVLSVSQAFVTPLSLISSDAGIAIDGRPIEPGHTAPNVMYNMVSPKYFDHHADPDSPRSRLYIRRPRESPARCDCQRDDGQQNLARRRRHGKALPLCRRGTKKIGRSSAWYKTPR